MTPQDSLCLSRVVGDVLQPFTASVSLRAHYSNKLIVNGARFKPSSLALRPRVQIGDSDMRIFYTLVMVDPDMPSPSNPTLGEYLHWLVADIPGNTTVEFGKELVSYERPAPTIGIHRLVFVLFKQAVRDTIHPPTDRHNFKVGDFARQFNLGLPVAALYLNCEREGGVGGRRFM